ncbi:hypothetical protein [Magnetospirillum sp. UT-4]|uniref:hypothetical protein n=1 Tax=Magnetospirillum sp. UT-4 TaxID=2681467 RepID=UPI001380B457|nr:hypothetical protein [Magnetospirillum sp. UT-4]CAA7618365.1 hypothetical protein MTBUT4_30038 [Magnetospirillum sp. UT-4]
MPHSRERVAESRPIRRAGPAGAEPDVRTAVLLSLIDRLDLCSFLCEPDCRDRLRVVLDTLSDEEFDRFERRYTSRYSVNQGDRPMAQAKTSECAHSQRRVQ